MTTTRLTSQSTVRSFAILAALALAISTVLAGDKQPTDWRTHLQNTMPLLGHRNWIVVVDSAYPWQTSGGIETVATVTDHLTVLKAVFDELSMARQVRPIIYTDAELKHVPEENAKGITAYRADLAKMLTGYKVQTLPHEQIIAKLDEAGKTFHVLVLKSNLVLPYTSVFFQLDCGYWSAEAEQKLRDAIKAAK